MYMYIYIVSALINNQIMYQIPFLSIGKT